MTGTSQERPRRILGVRVLVECPICHGIGIIVAPEGIDNLRVRCLACRGSGAAATTVTVDELRAALGIAEPQAEARR